MKKPKIAIVISHPIQHFCPLFVSYSQNPQWDIKVFFASIAGYKTFKDQNYNQLISWKNLNIENFNHVFLNGNTIINISNKIDAKNLGKELSKYNPNVLLIHGYAQRLQKRAYYWGVNNKKTIFYFSDSELRQVRSTFRKVIKRILLPYLFSRIAAFLTIGNANEEYYQHFKCNPNKLFRAGYPIDIFNYENFYSNRVTERIKLRSKFQITNDDIVCSIVGKLVEWKRQVDIIEALYSLEQNTNYKIILFIIGSGIMENNLKERAKKLKKHKVIFTGFVDAHELPKYYSASDIYLHPSSIEPHSVAISEAVYMGCPVLLSENCGSYGTYDDVQIGKNGFAFKTKDINNIAHLINTLSINKKMRLNFGEYSHNYAVESQKAAHSEGLEAALLANNLL